MYVPVDHGLAVTTLLRRRRVGPVPFPLSAPRVRPFYRARHAIYHVFRALGLRSGETVLAPDYHNTNEVAAIRAAGAAVRFYRIGRNLEPDLEQLTRLARSTNARVLFTIHYFGWPQPLKELLALCEEHDMLLFEDCALAFLSSALGRPLGSFGQYATYCLYKTLPVPNGGLLVENGPPLASLEDTALRPCGVKTLGGRLFELFLARLRGRWYHAGEAAFALKRLAGSMLRGLRFEAVPFGEVGFDFASLNLAMSPLSRSLLERFDYEDIRRRRRDNYRMLRERLDGGATMFARELEEGTCPLFFPILVPDKPAAARALARRGVGTLEFWNFGVPDARSAESAEAQFLHDHVLELPIHQDITPPQIEHMARQVLSLKLRL